MKKRSNFYYESRAKTKGFKLVAGIDEAGRGPLAGPVVAAAVVFRNRHRFKNRIDDSKKLTAKQRLAAYLEIIQKAKVGVGIVSENAIDQVNIFHATKIAMEMAIDSLCKSFNKGAKLFCLIDGTLDLNINYPYKCIIAGDSKSKTIAAASIIAKVTRDRIMAMYDQVWPEYGFIRHKGYATVSHRQAIEKFGPSLIHRRTFTPFRDINELSASDFR